METNVLSHLIENGAVGVMLVISVLGNWRQYQDSVKRSEQQAKLNEEYRKEMMSFVKDMAAKADNTTGELQRLANNIKGERE